MATSVTSSLERSGRWAQWQQMESRLAGFADLEAAREGWRRRDERCYQVVAGLTALGSRRGGDDDDAALAVAVLLEDGVNRVARMLSDVCVIDDVTATVWEEVKGAEPQLGRHAATYLLRRARQRLSRPAAGMVSRIDTTSLDAWLDNGWASTPRPRERASDSQTDRNLLIAVPEIEDPVEDLADLLTWAREVGVIATEEVDLLVELVTAEGDGMAQEEAQRVVGERHGLAMRTIRRRRDRIAARLRDAVPKYLAAIA
ncbi:hypothetical protein [Pimelobacter simplex]|uniref:hypothetical protein n=1 Tax=Nocardioides simplex TaxID=2045 RepID=UPI0021502FD1|nr:hypothetical protein [Pimelobacter simplex]UUW92492.1 hypothetical protein M0M43_13690 [Pimelobacter simplex]UUW96320.1 hypothetical protein M0M48_02325 [Pimelobacter simplex]